MEYTLGSGTKRILLSQSPNQLNGIGTAYNRNGSRIQVLRLMLPKTHFFSLKIS